MGLGGEDWNREVGWEHVQDKVCHTHYSDNDNRGEDHPLDLLALDRRGPPMIAVQQGKRKTSIKSDAHQGIERGQPPVREMIDSTKDGNGNK